MLERINTELDEFREVHDYIGELGVFVHPQTHFDVQGHDIDGTLFEDEMVETSGVVVLPPDVKDIPDECKFVDSITKHHVTQVLSEIEAVPGETPDETIYRSSVPIVIEKVVLEIEVDEIEADTEIPALGDLFEDPRASPDDVTLTDNIDSIVKDGIWKIETQFDERQIMEVPIGMMALGHVEQDRVQQQIITSVQQTINDKLISYIEDTQGNEVGEKHTYLGNLYLGDLNG